MNERKLSEIPAKSTEYPVISPLKDGKIHALAIDVSKQDARKFYDENWNGCRDLWKENYRKRKLAGPIEPQPKSPKLVEFERQEREREQARRDRFNNQQQKRYERWLKKHKQD